MESTFFEQAEAWLVYFKQRFAELGIIANPELQLVEGGSLLCYYEFDTQQILLSFPEPSNPKSLLHRLMLKEILAIKSDQEFILFLQRLLPYVIAHELTHHLRHYYRLLSNDTWKEEIIANVCAFTLTRDHLLEDPNVIIIIAQSHKNLKDNLALTDKNNPLHQTYEYIWLQIDWLFTTLQNSVDFTQGDIIDYFR